MGNPHRGEIDIEIGGKTRVIRLGLAEIAELDDALGQNALLYLEKHKMSVSFLSHALYIGMRARLPKLTRAHVFTWLEADFERFAYFAQRVMEAFNAALPGREAREAQADGDDALEPEAVRPTTPAAAPAPMAEAAARAVAREPMAVPTQGAASPTVPG